MSDTVVLAEPSSGRRCVWHRPVDRHGDGYVYFLDVELEDDGLTVRGRSCLNGLTAQDLPAFLADLDERWRGWEGTLTWTSMEGEMTLDAVHTGSRVRLGVTLRRPRRPYDPDAWSARVAFDLEPGEHLRDLARDAASVPTRPSA